MTSILNVLKRKVVITETPKVPNIYMVAPRAIATESIIPDLRIDSNDRFSE